MTAADWLAHLKRSIHAACMLEATARKPGNVHPGASFTDLCYADFVRAAEIVAPVLAETAERGVGPAVLEAVSRTQATLGKNVNLGIALLLAPLAAVPQGTSLADGIGDVLSALTQADAALVYRAIRLAKPGGLGTAPRDDVSGEPSGTLLDVMRLAADRDAVAAQYATGFETVLRLGLPRLQHVDNFAARWEEATIELHLNLMASRPDTLIARKRGEDEARVSASLAAAVEAAGLASEDGRRRIDRLDRWLRAEENARNPGTTADLVAATLFAALRERVVARPPWLERESNLAPRPRQESDFSGRV